MIKRDIIHYRLLLIALLFLVNTNFASNIYAETEGDISSKALVELSREFDGKEVSYRGEVITSILKRGEYAWVNLSDGKGVIGVWCASDLLDDVKFFGDYKHRGDILGVRGIFNRACEQHGGEMDIHATQVRIIEEGRELVRPFDRRMVSVNVALLVLTLLVAVIFRRRL